MDETHDEDTGRHRKRKPARQPPVLFVRLRGRGRAVVEMAALAAPLLLLLAYGGAAVGVAGTDDAGTVMQAGGLSGFLAVAPRAVMVLLVLLPTSLGLGLVNAALERLLHRLRHRPARWVSLAKYYVDPSLFLSFLLLVLFLTIGGPWWPLERLTLNGTATHCHGYVVGSQADGQYLVVLTEPERAVRFYPTEVVDRAVVDGEVEPVDGEVEPVAGSCPDGVARP